MFIGIIVLMIQSCKTSTKFTVYGEPGTEIMTPRKYRLATIDGNGTAKIKIKNKADFYSFLISHDPSSDNYIPFALDYKKKKYNNGVTLGATGVVAFVGGAVIDPAIMAAGLLFMGIGGCYAWNMMTTENHLYHFKYLPEQHTNQDLKFTKPDYIPAQITSTTAPSEPIVQNSSASTKKILSSESTKTLKDNATKIEGTYVGTGNLKSGNDVIEDYTGIKVIITKKSKDTVLVNVYESDGSKFFATDGEYSVQKLSNGIFSLTLKGIKNATIEIDTQNNLVYLHPRVNIENEIYTLNIKAKKN